MCEAKVAWWEDIFIRQTYFYILFPTKQAQIIVWENMICPELENQEPQYLRSDSPLLLVGSTKSGFSSKLLSDVENENANQSNAD